MPSSCRGIESSLSPRIWLAVTLRLDTCHRRSPCKSQKVEPAYGYVRTGSGAHDSVGSLQFARLADSSVCTLEVWSDVNLRMSGINYAEGLSSFRFLRVIVHGTSWSARFS